jgi:hypothetical protein
MRDRTKKQTEAATAGMKSVVIIYETPEVREHAIQFCEQVAAEQGDAALPELNWWSFHLLEQPAPAAEAVLKAAEADVVVFALDSRGDLPVEIKWWLEAWLNKRGEREGALVGLLKSEAEETYGTASFRELYLRNIAHRAGMDYLCHAAPTVAKAIPDSIDSFNDRAGQMTSVLDSILHEYSRPVPPRL